MLQKIVILFLKFCDFMSQPLVFLVALEKLPFEVVDLLNILIGIISVLLLAVSKFDITAEIDRILLV